jgi:hypothetical protein
MSQKNFFCYDGDSSTDFFATEEEAVAAANTAIQYWRDLTIDDGEWPCEVERVYWGRIHGAARGFISYGDGSVDYRIVPMTEVGE